MTLRIGVDVGGTFTDVFLYDSARSRFWLAKTPSTPANQAEGVIKGIVEVCAQGRARASAPGRGAARHHRGD